jgi:hypothetical protein
MTHVKDQLWTHVDMTERLRRSTKGAEFLHWLSNYQLVKKQGILERDISSSHSFTVSKSHKRDEE